MTYKDANYWHIKDKFLKEKPRDLLANIVLHDGRNARNIPLKAQRDLKDLDEALAFFIELLQVLYKQRESWQEDIQKKASIAMINAALNHHLLARHAVIIGYDAEIFVLYRGCFERMSRALLFLINEKSAKDFWKGKQIMQGRVNSLISRELEMGRGKSMYEAFHRQFKEIWSNLSNVSHPNLSTLNFRLLKVEGRTEEESKGIDVPLGGMSGEAIVSIGIDMHLTYLEFSLFMMRVIVGDYFNRWNKKLERKMLRFRGKNLDITISNTERFLSAYKDIIE